MPHAGHRNSGCPESPFGLRFTAANAQVPLDVVFANSFE